MKPQSNELREPTCCCVGVRKTTITLAFVQACLLFFSLTVCVMGVFRTTHGSFGYMAEGDMSIVAISYHGRVYAETVEVEVHKEGVISANLIGLDSKLSENGNAENSDVVPSDLIDASIPEGVQIRIIDTYQVEAISMCRARRDVMLVLGTISLASCLTVLALVGACRVKPSYMLPYVFMHLCDLILTAGALLTACTYVRSAREWLAMQRYVDIDPATQERLQHLSDAELHTALVMVGSFAFGFKALWFLITCRCYSYLVQLRERRILNELGLLASPVVPLVAATRCTDAEATLMVPADYKTETDAALKQPLVSYNEQETKPTLPVVSGEFSQVSLA